MDGLLSIGDFSRITHLSVKTLRRYHDSGLLEPTVVDPFSSYRYYGLDQVATAQVIRRFRDLGLPEREVAAVLATPDPVERGRVVAAHLARLEAQLDRTRDAVSALRRLLDPEPAPLEVDLRTTPATLVAAVTGTVDHGDVLTWYSDAMLELRAAVVRPTGPAGGLYDNELFTDERGGAVVFVPTPDPPTVGRVHPLVLPAAELATAVHHGSHADIDVTYGALGSWVQTHSLRIGGPVRETYLVGPRDTPDDARWRTEIGWPVFTAAPLR